MKEKKGREERERREREEEGEGQPSHNEGVEKRCQTREGHFTPPLPASTQQQRTKRKIYNIGIYRHYNNEQE